MRKFCMLRVSIILAVLSVLSASRMLAESTLPFRGEVNSSKINLRQDSTVSAPIICTLNKGTRVEVVLESYDWYKIKLPKSAPSFVRSDLAECINSESEDFPVTAHDACNRAKILKDNVNVRLAPSESAYIVGRVNKDDVVNILKATQGWYKIEPVPNSFGWVHKRFISKATEEQKIEIVKIQEIKEEVHQKAPAAETVKSGSVSLTGIIRPYGKIFKRKATHKLITADNRVFLLKGDKKILDALNYRKVKVSGNIIDSQSKYPILEYNILETVN